MKLKIDKTWTLFLDRDGVINHRIWDGYVMKKSQLKLKDGVGEAISKFNQLFARVVVVTNQQGIGKGLMTEDDLKIVHDYLKERLAKKSAFLDGIYFCPELAKTGATCRKPESGMALQAQKDFPEINFLKSIMVGDTGSDIEFGKRLGMKTVYIRTKEETLTPETEKKCDLVLDELSELDNFLEQIST